MHAKAKYASQFRHNQTTEAAAGQIQAPTAASIASTPVRRVGSITGAKFGAWLAGSSSSLPASFAFSYVVVTMTPTTENTAGTFQAVPNSPKSSLRSCRTDLAHMLRPEPILKCGYHPARAGFIVARQWK